jgi:hypothetical protein
VGIYFSGGVLSLIAPWLGLLPLMAFSLVNQKNAIVWFCISLLTFIAFAIFKNELALVTHERNAIGSLVSLFGFTTLIFLFMQLFHKTETNLLLNIKKKNDGLIEQNEEIATQNEEIVAQNEEVTQQRDEIASQRDFIEQQNKKLILQNRDIAISNQQLALRVKEIFDRNLTLEKHWHTLLGISKSRSVNFGDLEEAFRYLPKLLRLVCIPIE